MRRLIIISVLVMVFYPLAGQYRYRHPEIFYMPAPIPASSAPEDNSSKPSPWVSYSLETGSFFTSANAYNSISTFVSPKVLIPVKGRFFIEAGTSYMRTSVTLPGEEGRQSYSSLLGYVRGIYTLNERTTLYGEAVKSLFSDNPLIGQKFESYTLGMEYFITPNFRIGASITSVNGYDPASLMNPYRSSSFGSPFFY